MKLSPVLSLFMLLMFLSLTACDKLKEQYGEYGGRLSGEELSNVQPMHEGDSDVHQAGHQEVVHEAEHEATHAGHHHVHKIVATSPVAKDVITTQQFVCQIHSRRHIEVRALEGGYLEAIHVQEGQTVRRGDLMFKVLPILLQAKLNADVAEAQLSQIEFDNTKQLFQKGVVSDQEVALAGAKLAKVQAKVDLARAELDFTNVKAPFDGIVDRQFQQLGSLIEEGDILTTLSDNSVMWVYFNVPEARYLDYQAGSDHNEQDLSIELVLANGKKFEQTGTIGAIEADFNNETGNIAFRADFSNPAGLLRHGQTGAVLINRVLKDAVVIPQRATFEILAKRYAFVIGQDSVVHQREIVIQAEQDDIFVIKDGLAAGETIVLEGIRQVRDGDKVEFEFRDPTEVLGQLKNHAE